MKLLAGFGRGKELKAGKKIMIDNLLSHALIFKPKKLKEPWEHKKGFQVEYDVKSALNFIEKQRESFRKHVPIKTNFHQNSDYKTLRILAKKRLYEIESSLNNYIEVICCIGGLFLTVFAINLLSTIWNYPTKETVQLFLLSLAVIVALFFIYRRKKSHDLNLVYDFLNIEDALFRIEYGESQYQTPFQVKSHQ
ncbi:hypothetical protein [Acinetobacter nosocomialis]|uniref:hypothetical protein n=1 Tax=Acinetobacter nosocomialis TaxID=106654 RepID=UPI0024B66C4F|nr:hypothetical protein [Acinetobacter nosocomialis]MDI9659418.1 hypothetical protein [Acinetobacter nosocomialis]